MGRGLRSIIPAGRRKAAGAGTVQVVDKRGSRSAAAGRKQRYSYTDPEPSVLLNQRAVWERLEKGETPAEALGSAFSVLKTDRVPKFSVIVTAYEPVLKYFEQTLISVLSQTFGGFEVIIADTSMSSGVHDLLEHYRDERIRYYSVPGNRGDASLINGAAVMATGDYLCRVDVGDLLTKDALYEVFSCIMRTEAEILYTDEDHCDAAGKKFDDPNRKPDFNKDYLLATNYMQHLLVMRKELFLALRMRDPYDGALEYDLVLRAPKSEVCHVPQILYHVSSASSQAQEAAREPGSIVAAGRNALEDYLRERAIHATVSYSSRRGIYRINYKPDIFACRQDVGVLGGRVLSRTHKVLGGMYDARGQSMYEGWDESEGGPHNRALAVQDAFAVDVRCMRIRPELSVLYENIFGVSYEEHVFGGDEDLAELRRKSILFCGMARDIGYLVVWDPAFIAVV